MSSKRERREKELFIKIQERKGYGGDGYADAGARVFSEDSQVGCELTFDYSLICKAVCEGDKLQTMIMVRFTLVTDIGRAHGPSLASLGYLLPSISDIK